MPVKGKQKPLRSEKLRHATPTGAGKLIRVLKERLGCIGR